jgi:hypothetical protein
MSTGEAPSALTGEPFDKPFGQLRAVSLSNGAGVSVLKCIETRWLR